MKKNVFIAFLCLLGLVFMPGLSNACSKVDAGPDRGAASKKSAHAVTRLQSCSQLVAETMQGKNYHTGDIGALWGGKMNIQIHLQKGNSTTREFSSSSSMDISMDCCTTHAGNKAHVTQASPEDLQHTNCCGENGAGNSYSNHCGHHNGSSCGHSCHCSVTMIISFLLPTRTGYSFPVVHTGNKHVVFVPLRLPAGYDFIWRPPKIGWV